APEATAYYHRQAPYVMSLVNCWLDPSEDHANIEWVRTTWTALQTHLPRRVYVNELQEEGADRVRDAYGPAFSRLAAIKRQYDPDNIFLLNQNIPPALRSGARDGPRLAPVRPGRCASICAT